MRVRSERSGGGGGREVRQQASEKGSGTMRGGNGS